MENRALGAKMGFGEGVLFDGREKVSSRPLYLPGVASVRSG
jgi:hypothetical protein